MLQGANKDKEMCFNGVHKSGFHTAKWKGGARCVVSHSRPLPSLIILLNFTVSRVSPEGASWLDVIHLFTAVHLCFFGKGPHLIGPSQFSPDCVFPLRLRQQPRADEDEAEECETGRSDSARRAASLKRKLLPRGMCLLRPSLTHHVVNLQSR